MDLQLPHEKQMTIATAINFFDNMIFGSYTGNNDGHWDGYSGAYETNLTGGILQGYFLNWGGFDMQTVIGAATEIPYMGYNSNWSNLPISPNFVFDTVDINSVIDQPKDQTIYYKLKGWNPLTSSYESWIITENITGRPEQFSATSGRQPPNVERDIFKTAPSGNSLVNIVIAARWIQ